LPWGIGTLCVVVVCVAIVVFAFERLGLLGVELSMGKRGAGLLEARRVSHAHITFDQYHRFKVLYIELHNPKPR